MKQFVFGNKTQFDSLYSRIISANNKRIKFDVVLPNGDNAKLEFTSADRQKVKLLLVANTDGSALTYQGRSDFMRQLVSDGRMEFSDSDDMRTRFSQARADYEAVSANSTNSRPHAKKAKSSGRIIRQRAVVDTDELANRLKACIIGQDAQIDGLTNAVCNHLRKKNPKKPIVIMLAGPTGVGKSETVRRLADMLQDIFGKEQLPLISINCNEFKESYRISQLTGSPAGYVGHDEPCLMEPLKKTDSAIILFDEYEKAHSDIHIAVMSWMDTGKITFSRMKVGETSAEYNCAGSIIILTSNIDMHDRSAVSMRFDVTGQEAETQINNCISNDDRCRRIMVNNGFKPEIAGRVSRFFEYKALTKADIAKIALLTFKSKFVEYGFVVDEISESLMNDIKDHYTSSTFGVRPLENALDEVLGRQLPPIPEGEQHLRVGGTLKNLIFTEV